MRHLLNRAGPRSQDVRRAGAFYGWLIAAGDADRVSAGELPPSIDGIRRFRIDARRFAERRIWDRQLLSTLD